jgi:hypothetical protein
MREMLREVTLEDLVSTPRRNGRVATAANGDGVAQALPS